MDEKSLTNMDEESLTNSNKDGKIVYYSLDDDHINKLLTVSLEHIN